MPGSYRREIDGLRAIAVTAVVLYHAGIGSAGFVGVDIFFVISGYLITALLLREQATKGRIDLVAFYARRLRRIIPAVTVVIFAVLGASVIVLHPVARAALTESAMAAAVFVANIYFQLTTGGYFQDSAELMPLLHLWSLSVEEQFYLLWPALLMLVPRRALVPVLAGLAVGSFALAEGLSQQAAFYQMPARFWELAIGGLVATLPRRQLPRWAVWVGLGVILDAVVIPMEHFPGVGALPAVLGAAIVIATVHGGGVNRLLASRPFVGAGLISYSLYLWHWPLLALYRAGGGYSEGMRLALCGAAVVLAIGSYRYIEQPFRRGGTSRKQSLRAVLAGVAAFAVLAATANAMRLKELTSDQVVASNDKPRQECHNTLAPPASCASAPGPITVAIWGDSMAWAWQPFAAEIARRERTAAIGISMDACKPALGFANRPHCPAFAAAALERVRRMDTVILAGAWSFEFYEINPAGAEAAMRSTLEGLKGVRRVIVLGPTPAMRKPAFRCMEGEDICEVTEAEFLHQSAPARASLQRLVAAYPNAQFVDAGRWFCPSGTCTATRDGMVLYFDTTHVSMTAARAFAAQFRDPGP